MQCAFAEILPTEEEEENHNVSTFFYAKVTISEIALSSFWSTRIRVILISISQFNSSSRDPNRVLLNCLTDSKCLCMRAPMWET